jgi:tetratricopeptide (TPR) repeat protein
MTMSFLKKNKFFYPAVICLWAVFLLVRYGGHRYFDTPLPSAGTGEIGGRTGAASSAQVSATIIELRSKLFKENKKAARAPILENLGYAFYEMYKGTGERAALDSALYFVKKATIEGPGNAQLHCNFGGLLSEIGDSQHALEQYELALRIDSTHILALLNAGMCSYFAFGRRADAARFFTRALALDDRLPMCHSLLGLINLDEKDPAAARENFEKEVAADGPALVKNHVPLTSDNVRFAAAIAHHNLMELYSTKFTDRKKAYGHFNEYLKIEADPSKKEKAAQEMKGYWSGK